MREILRVLVGSHAHGLATTESDRDVRGVFVVPTTDLLRIGGGGRKTVWEEGRMEDVTSWELGHFLLLSLQSNPTILETYLAPQQGTVRGYWEDKEAAEKLERENWEWGTRLRKLFPYVWSAERVRDAFIGYGHNQRKKFLGEGAGGRRAKYAVAYLRTLYQGWELLTTGTFTVKVVETRIGPTLRRFRGGDFTLGEVVDICEFWQAEVENAYDVLEKTGGKESDIGRVNDFLLEVREAFFREV